VLQHLPDRDRLFADRLDGVTRRVTAGAPFLGIAQ
jgi:hypothetical protein